MRFLVPLLCLIVFPAMAQPSPDNVPLIRQISIPMTTVDMTVVLKDDAGKPIVDQFLQTQDDPACTKCGELTLGHAVAHALFASFPDEKDLAGEQKWARGELAEKVKDDPKAKISAAQIVIIKTLIGKLYNGMIVTRVYPLLDPSAAPPALIPPK